MQILNLKDLDIIKGYFKQELHPRARGGKFVKKHTGIVSPVVKEEPKKAPKTGTKAKPKTSTPKKGTKGKTTPKKIAGSKVATTKKTTSNKKELVVSVPVVKKVDSKKIPAKKPAKKPAKTSESAAPKMPPIVDNPVKKRVPKPKVVSLPKANSSESSDLAPDFQNKGRVRIVARRTGSYAVPSTKVNSTDDVASIFADLADADREKSYVMGTKNGEVVGIHCAHIGNINSSIIDPKDMMKVPVLSGADTVYLIHNHPGGYSNPSPEDKTVTKRFQSVADSLDITFGGHVVIGDDNYNVLDGEGEHVGFRKDHNRKAITRSEQAPIYETYQEKDKTVPEINMHSGGDIKRYIKDNLNLLDGNKAIYIIGADNQNAITHAEPLDVTLPPAQLRKKAMESLIKGNCRSFFIFTGHGSADTLHNVGIQGVAGTLGIQLYDVIVPTTDDEQSLKDENYMFLSYAEMGIMNVVKGIYIDLQKALTPGKVTKTQAKSLHKELPPGGVWRSMNGHHIYILNGKVLAGAIPGVKSAKKATKDHLAEHQETIDKEAKAAAKLKRLKARRDPAGIEDKKKPKTGKEAIEDALKKPNPKTKGTKVNPKYMEKQKKAVDALANKPKPKSKKATLEEQQAEAKKMLEPTTKPRDKAKDILNSKNDKQDKIIQAASELTEAKRATDKVIKRKGVNDIRTEKQANNETAYDVGAKIGGARKDAAVFDAFLKSLSGQSLGDVEKMSPEQAQKLCVKKNLLKPVDFEADYKRGVDINVAITKQLIYDRVTPKPSDDTPEARSEYLHAIKELQRQLEPVISWDELKKATRNLGDWMKAETPKNMNEQQRYLDYAQKQYEKEPTDDDLKERVYTPGSDVKWVVLTRDEWKKKKLERVNDVKRDIEFAKKTAQSPYAPLGEKLTNFFTNYESRDRTMQTVASKSMTWDKYISKQKEASEAPKEEKGAKTKAKWEKAMPAKIQRSGGRETKVQKPEEMVKTFGFKGIEFGNWVDDKSGNFHLVKCAEAFHDLADILGLQDKDVSMNGKLSMAFGARGKGKALAHYESLSKAINITKEGGAGSLAHEWGHAMDNILYQESVGRNSTNLASEGIGDAGDKRIKASYEVLMDAILKGDGSGIEYVDNKNNDYYSYYPKRRQAVEDLGIAGAVHKYSKELDSARDRALSSTEDWAGRYNWDKAKKEKEIKKILRKHVTDKNAMVQEMAFHHKKLTGEVLDKIPVPNGMSQFYTDSKNVGGDTDYWISNCELFARAFETYVESKMRTGKIKNDYLVHGSWYDAKATPYPKGKERDAINGAFDELMKNVRNSGAIQKGLSFGLQKGIIRRSNLQRPAVPSIRSAYQVDGSSFDNPIDEILHIPTNRLQTPFQTDKALDFDKVRSLVARMEDGSLIAPIVIGWNYEVHDGHHKLEASKIQGYTHCPCIIGEFNDIDKQRLFEEYSELWKSLADQKGRGSYAAKVIIAAYNEAIGSKKPDAHRYENGPDIIAHASGDYGDYWAQIWGIGMDWNNYYFMIDSEHDKPRLIASIDDTAGDKEHGAPGLHVYEDGPKEYAGKTKYPWATWQRLCDAWVLKRAKKLTKSLKTDIEGNDLNGEKKAILDYSERLQQIKDPKVRKVIAEIIKDEKNHEYNLKKVLAYLAGDKLALDDLQKSLVYLPGVDTGLSAFPYEAPGIMFRGIGQKEYDFIQKSGYIQTKGKGNDEDQEDAVTCFSTLFSQAEGYARSNYDLYNEKQAYVIGVKYRGTENELGEIEVRGKTPASSVIGVVPVLKTPIIKGLYIDLQKSITRADAKKIHKDLPPGGVWKTMSGHHIYIKDGKVLAGSIEGIKGAKKATKAHLAEHQATVDKQSNKPSVHKSEKPMYSKGKGEGTSKTKGVDAKMGERLSATKARKLMGEYGVPAGHREAVLSTLKHSTTSNSFSARPRDELDVTGSKQVIGREYSAVDVQKAVESYKKDKKFAKDIATKSVTINEAVKQGKKAKSDAKVQKEREYEEFLGKVKANTDQMYKDQEAREAKKNRTPEQVAADEKAFADFDPLELLMAGTEPKKEKPKVQVPETEAVTPYHIATKDKKGKAKYMPVHEHAEKVNVGKGIHAFIHGRDGDWTVSEARSGLKITSNSSRNLAIKIAKELVERNRSNLDSMIQKHIDQHGESPKTAPTFDEYVKKQVKGGTEHLSAESWAGYRRSYDYQYNGIKHPSEANTSKKASKEVGAVKETKNEVTLYHGSNKDKLTTIKKNSWYTPEKKFADKFAEGRTKQKKGKARTYEIKADLDSMKLVDLTKFGIDDYATIPDVAKEFKVSEKELRDALDKDVVGKSINQSESPVALRYLTEIPSVNDLLVAKGYHGIKAKEGLTSAKDYVPTYKLFGEHTPSK